MSVQIKHLNADSSFLIIFSPAGASHNPNATFPGSFTILIDPWLSGPSTVYHTKFSTSSHVIPSCVSSLLDLPIPDIVLLSQEKTDHCHRATLTELSPTNDTLVLGTSAAANKVRAWNHFLPSRVQTLQPFDQRRPKTVYRMPVPSFSPSGTPGQVTISLVTSRFDISGLHNAIGITYQPPSSVLSFKHGTFIRLPTTPTDTSPSDADSYGTFTSTSTIFPPQGPPKNLHDSPYGSREKTISILYTPHGIDYSLLKPYCTFLLLTELALPLTVLIHSFSRVTNPWYLGGNISAGAVGGIEIVKHLFARVWIGAHDEEKKCQGFAVRSIKIEMADLEHVKSQLRAARNGAGNMMTEKPKEKEEATTALINLESGGTHVVMA